jgi:hypothetical protein
VELLVAPDQYPHCRIERPHPGTKVALLIVTRSDAHLLLQQLKDRGIIIEQPLVFRLAPPPAQRPVGCLVITVAMTPMAQIARPSTGDISAALL